MKAKLFSSKSRTQPQVELSQGYSSQPIPDPQYLPPNQYPPSRLPVGSEPQLPLEPPPGQRHFSIPTIPSIETSTEGSTSTYSRASQDLVPDQRYSAYLPPNSPIAPVEREPKRGLRDRLGIGHSSKQSVDQNQSRSSGLGRTLSVRRKENQDRHPSPTEEQHRGLRGGSSSQLLAHNEEEESAQHNTFTITHQFQGPPVPAKDTPSNVVYVQPSQQQHQVYYPPPPPPLQRVDTDHSIQTTPPIDTFSPAGQHPAYLSDNQTPSPFVPTQLQQPQQLQQDFSSPGSALGLAHIQPPSNQGGPYTYQPTNQELEFQGRHQLAQQQDPVSALSGRSSFEAYQKPQQQQVYPPPETQKSSQARSSNPPVPVHNPVYLQAPQVASLSAPEPPSPLQQPVPDHQVTPQTVSQEPSPTDSQTGSSTTMPTGPPRGSSMRQGENLRGMPPTSRDAPSLGPRGQSYREEQSQQPERGRDSPPRDLTAEDAENYVKLLKEHKEFKDKYNKVKKLYFEREAQVHHLQNTLANQRLSQSRTSLDDSEYTARFSRLEGLISQLAFAIRKNWKRIPDFLERAVNKEAMATGKHEMTAVGRAFISYWLVSEIFDKYFHPDLDIVLSQQLQRIYHNIRRSALYSQSAEEEENLQSKVINWRLTTLEGLQDQLRSPEAAQHNETLVELLNHKLADDLAGLLQDPPPPDLQSSIPMIVELAVKIAMHLPCESREVMVDYYRPGMLFAPELMRVETGIPVLTNPIEAPKESPSEEGSVKSAGAKAAVMDEDQLDDMREKDDKTRRGMFGGLMSGGQALKKPTPASVDPRAVRGSNERAGGSQTQLTKESGRETPQMKEERVRMCVGVSVQIRGRSVLTKAPVYAMAS